MGNLFCDSASRLSSPHDLALARAFDPASHSFFLSMVFSKVLEGFKYLCCLCLWARLAFLLLKPLVSGSHSLSVCFCLAASHPAFPMDLPKCDLHDFASSKKALSTPPASCHSLNSLLFPSEISSSHVCVL